MFKLCVYLKNYFDNRYEKRPGIRHKREPIYESLKKDIFFDETFFFQKTEHFVVRSDCENTKIKEICFDNK